MSQSTVEYPERDVEDQTEEAPIRVLHVDDEAGFLKVAKQILEMQGAFQVETASSVEEAIKKMKRKRFDVVVSDYQMPEKDGLEFLKELRDSGYKIPFILFTGKGREEVAIEALNFGADQYINKIGKPETVYFELSHAIRKAVERKKAEMKLIESEEEHRILLDMANVLIQSVDAEGRLVYVNSKWMKKLGYTEKDLEKITLMDIIRKDHHPFCMNMFKQVMEGKPVYNVETVFVSKDGREIIVSGNVMPRFRKGKFVSTVGFFVDVTEQRKAEERIRASEERYRSLFENAKDVTLTLNLKGKITSINKAAVEYGFKKDEIIGKSMLDFTSKKNWPKLLGMLLQLARGRKVEGNIEINTPRGKKIAEYSSTPIIIDNKVVGVQTILRDITERKEVEEKVKKASEEWMRTFDAISDFVFVLDNDHRLLRVNKATCDALKKEPEELIGKRCFEVFHGTNEPIQNCPCERMSVTKEAATEEINDPNLGLSLLVTVSPLFDDNGELIGCAHIAKDITERKKTLEELKSSRERLKILFEFAPDAYYLNDLKGNFIDGNRAAEELMGYDRSELVGKSFLKLKLLPRRQIPKAAKLLALNAFGKPTGPDEFVLNRKDGSQVPVEIRTFPVKIKNQTLVLGIARDITKRKQADTELKRAMEKLEIMNEKLGVVGKLTRHDARNKLSTVTMSAFSAKRKLAGDREALEHLNQIESACGQVERIFEFARIYEMLGMEELAYMNVEKSLGEAVMLFSDLRGVEVVNDCRGLTVLADSLLRQILYNLIDNSLKHGEKVSRIKAYYEEAGKDKLKLVYEDDGVGIPRAEKEKIFNEGYGKCAGHGLYLIRKMCEVYGWAIRETGKQGKGAQFTITIPQINQEGKASYKYACMHS